MVVPYNPNYPIVSENGIITRLFRKFINEVSEESLLIGTGTPEGVLEAKQGRRYMNDAGTTGSILYIKKLNDIAGDRKKGWILV